MKKILVACLAVVALFAIATSANAITCTQDQRPAATLLIPYFQATFNADGTILGTGPSALDTLVTIGNASSAPMLAHVSVWSERTELVLDFMIALTGFDIQAFSMASILRGNLPVTPVNQLHQPEVKDSNQVTINGDVCQRNALAPVYPAAGGYLRVRPTLPASSNDSFATVSYPPGPFASAFLFQVIDSLDVTKDSFACGGVDNIIQNPIHGYVTIDHANYCSLANPNDPPYWTNDAGGFENNLWGDYIFTSASGVNTIGFPAVAIEATNIADAPLGSPSSLSDNTGAPTNPAFTGSPGKRTFYRRYVTTADTIPCANPMPAPQSAWDCGFGDQREPLGLKYAARWFDSSPTVTSFFNVWRASAGLDTFSGGLQDLLGFPFGKCNTVEPTILLGFFDEDENTVTSGCVVSPCNVPTVNFPLETQRTSITAFTHPSGPAGWVSMNFFNPGGPLRGTLDQAYVTYDFQGPAAFLSAGVVGTQLDPSTCQPLLVPCTTAPGCFGATDPGGVNVTLPLIPVTAVGKGP